MNLQNSSRLGSSRLGLAALVALSLSPIACRSKIDVKSKDGASVPVAQVPEIPPVDPVAPEPTTDPAPPEPVEKKGAASLQGGKVYFQTRDTITINIKREVIDGADSFSLLNITNSGTDDSKAVQVVQEKVPSLGLHEGGFALATVDDQTVQLQFFPGDSQFAGKFFYGKNILKVVANDEANPRYATVEIFLQDFDVFGVAVTSFSTDVQVAIKTGAGGFQFQGWVNVLSPPTVTLGANVLTNGIFNMVNPQ